MENERRNERIELAAKPASKSETRWQFSLRALLFFTAVVAAVAAFAANYPTIALIVACGAMFALVEMLPSFSQPQVYAKHPFLVTTTWFITAVFCLAYSGILWWSVFSATRATPFWVPMIPALMFGGFGCFCIHLLWSALRKPTKSEHDDPEAKH